MAAMKHLAEDLAYKYLETHPKASWEEAMEYACGEGSDEDEERRKENKYGISKEM